MHINTYLWSQFQLGCCKCNKEKSVCYRVSWTAFVLEPHSYKSYTTTQTTGKYQKWHKHVQLKHTSSSSDECGHNSEGIEYETDYRHVSLNHDFHTDLESSFQSLDYREDVTVKTTAAENNSLWPARDCALIRKRVTASFVVARTVGKSSGIPGNISEIPHSTSCLRLSRKNLHQQWLG